MARLAFFGTPEFAVPSLEMLHKFCKAFGHDLIFVVTQPDKVAKRGQKLQYSPVKKAALKRGLPIYQPTTLRKNEEEGERFFANFLKAKIDVAVVVAYGKIIPKRILNTVSIDFLNVHASLLPRFRGAAPIQRALMMGDKTTGVCLMRMIFALDQGAVYACKKTPILPSDNAYTLSYRLSNLGGRILYDNLQSIIESKIDPIPQIAEGVSYAKKIEKQESRINFHLKAEDIHNHIRAFSPYPGVFGFIYNKRVKLLKSFYINHDVSNSISPGTIIVVNRFLGIKTIDGAIYVEIIQFEGKKVLPVHEALKGMRIKVNDVVKSFFENK